MPLDYIECEVNWRINWLFMALAEAREVGFVPFESDTEFKNKYGYAYYDSYYGIGILAKVRKDAPPLFQADRHPYVPELSAHRGYFCGPKVYGDFLRHEYTFDGLHILVFEGVNEVLVLLPGRGKALVPLGPAARVAEVGRVAAKLLADPWKTARWHLRRGGGETDGIAYTTAPKAPLGDWAYGRVRMDAGVWKDDLYYVYYKIDDEQQAHGRSKLRWFVKKKGRR